MESRTCSVCELTFEADGHRFRADTAVSAFVLRGTAHTNQNFREDTAHVLGMVTPAGLERFFEDLTALHKGVSQPVYEAVARRMQSYGMYILGPPLAE